MESLTATTGSYSLSSQRLLGKVAIITGGADGIGEGIVRLFHQHGAKICIADIQDRLGRQVRESLVGQNGNDVTFLHCDVTKQDDVSRAVDFVVETYGKLDIMVNNAGITGTPNTDIRTFDMAEFDKVFEVNVKGVFLGMKEAARVMIPAKKGSIVSISSVSGVVGGLGSHAYTSSKHAVVGLTKSAAAELGLHGIKVNCVSPYAVPTAMSRAHLPQDESPSAPHSFWSKKANLRGVELTVDDVANAVLFLASEDSSYVSGLDLLVDGGFSSSNHALQVFRSS